MIAERTQQQEYGVPYTESARESAEEGESFGLMPMRDCRRKQQSKPDQTCASQNDKKLRRRRARTEVKRCEDWSLLNGRDFRLDVNSSL